jgi:colicin import membrane protein
MSEFISKHWAYLIGAVLLHLAFAAIFGLTLVNIWSKPLKPTLAIQAVVVDRSVIDRAARQQQRERAQERERQQAEQRRQQEKREAEQRAEQDRQQEQKQREQEQQRRQAEEQQVREKQETERKAQAEADRQRKVEAEQKRVAEIERKQKEEAARRKAADDAKLQQQREADLKSQIEEEEGRAQAANAGLLNQYIAMIQQAIVRNWNRPPSARAGLECTVKVAQTPSGTVLSVQVDKCNGDAAVKQSVEAAVLKASPLPPPPDPRVFERNLVFVFKPLED